MDNIEEVYDNLYLNLTPNGKTLAIIYAKHEVIAEALISQLGEPEREGYIESDPDALFLIFPHQNLGEDLMDAAERMTSQSILDCLEQGIPIQCTPVL